MFQKLKFNGKEYSVVTSQIRMSIYILEFPHNKDFYLYKKQYDAEQLYNSYKSEV